VKNMGLKLILVELLDNFNYSERYFVLNNHVSLTKGKNIEIRLSFVHVSNSFPNLNF